VTIRRSGLGCRETSGPPTPKAVVRSPRLRGTSPLGNQRERVGSARGAGARKSFGWQMSVGRIARLLHRSIARSDGGQKRALARKKSVAPPDAGARMDRRRIGAGVLGRSNRFSQHIACGSRLAGSRYDRRRSWALPVVVSTTTMKSDLRASGGPGQSPLTGRSTPT